MYKRPANTVKPNLQVEYVMILTETAIFPNVSIGQFASILSLDLPCSLHVVVGAYSRAQGGNTAVDASLSCATRTMYANLILGGNLL